jgi:hypothetical protein
MGGPGSGRWYRWQGTRTTLDAVYRLDVRWLHRQGYLDGCLHWVTHILRGLLPKALEVLQCELEGEHPLPAAVHVLKACGLYGMVIPHGPTEVDDALLAEQERQSERRRKALMAAAW